MKRSFWAAVICAALAAGCSAPEAATPPETAAAAFTPTLVARNAFRGGNFRQALTTDAKSFHVYQATDVSSKIFQSEVYASGLWRRDPKTLLPIPNMAESWDVSSDGKTYTFKLRRDLKWSDGAALTANDFQWTFEQANNPSNKYPTRDTLSDIVSYAAVDEYTLAIALKDATCAGLSTADAITPLPKHTWEKLDWNDPAKNPEILKPTVVSGPYKLIEWVKGDHATFGRNDSFWRSAPLFDSETIRIVADPAMQYKMLKSGDLDWAPVAAADYADAKKSDTLKEYDWDPANAAWTYIGFNMRRTFLKDADVRHALSYAIPRQSIVDKAFNGLAKPMYSIFPPTAWAYNPDVPHYDYNIETAKAMLGKAGYKTDAKGRLMDKQGLPIQLKVFYNMENKSRAQTATMVQEEFKKLGIDAPVNGMEFQAYQDYLKTPPFDFDLYISGWIAAFEPYYNYQILAEKNIPDLNVGGYVNKQVEDLFTQSNRAPCDLNARKTIYQQIQQLVSADSPYIFLTYNAGYAFLNKRIAPNEPTGLGIFYLPELWYFRPQ